MANPVVPPSGPPPKPSGPDEAREYLKEIAFPSPDVQLVTMTAMEFTSVCPRTGQADFGAVTIEYAPNERCIESRGLKHYLGSYRDQPAFCEALAARIADDIVYAIDPKHVEVELKQNICSGIEIVATAARPA